VSENDQPVSDFTLQASEDGAVYLSFVIDRGRYSNYANFGEDAIRAAMRTWADGGYFRDGVDTVEVLATLNTSTAPRTITLLEPTSSLSEFQSFVDTADLDRSQGSTQAFDAVSAAIERQTDAQNTGARAVILLTPIVDSLNSTQAAEEAQRTGNAAREQGAAVSVLHTNLQGQFADPLVTVADLSGGQYLLLERGADQLVALDRLYNAIDARRAQFEISYRSSSGQSGPREVTVSTAGGTAAGSYQVSLTPAQVSLAPPPANGNYTVAPAEEEVEGAVQTVDLTASIAWPDGYPRTVETAQVVVNDQVVDTISTPDDTFTFSLDLTEYAAEESTDLTVAVQIEDTLGLEAEAQPVTLTLNVPESVGILNACQAGLSLTCVVSRGVAGLLAIGLLIVGIGGVLFLRSRSTSSAPASSGGGAVSETLVADVIKPAGGGAAPSAGGVLAYLRIVEGPSDKQGEVIAINENTTKIGRNPGEVDVVFYEREQSSISGWHCTIQHYRGVLFLADENSTNGTFVNGVRVMREDPIGLNNGDIIVLGDLNLKGIQLNVELGKAIGVDAAARKDVDYGKTQIDLQMQDNDKTMVERSRPDRTQQR
jgi:hypothetical protein